MGTPIVFAMLGQRVALRSSEAALIEISLEHPNIDYTSEETLSKRFFASSTAETAAIAAEAAGSRPSWGPASGTTKKGMTNRMTRKRGLLPEGREGRLPPDEARLSLGKALADRRIPQPASPWELVRLRRSRVPWGPRGWA